MVLVIILHHLHQPSNSWYFLLFINKGIAIAMHALTMDTITSNLPTTPLNPSFYIHISTLTLADPHFNISGRIDLLIGAEV